MDIYSKVVKHIVYPLWSLKDGNYRHLKYLNELEKSQWLSREEMQRAQWEKLKKLISHAYENCRFYNNRFKEIGLKPEDIQAPEDFQKIPILTKRDVQENLYDFVAQNYDTRFMRRNATGGSTGNPTIFYMNKERCDWGLACAARHDRWTGWQIGEKIGLLWGADRDVAKYQKLKANIRNKLLERMLILNAFDINEDRMKHYALKLKQYKPKILLAYANVIYLFAQFVKAEGIKGIRPSAIISSAEVLSDDKKILIENVFECKVFNRYGSREVGVIASECSHHNGLHINEETLYVEFIPYGPLTSDSTMTNSIILTDLLNYGMPFIRYDTGDVGTSSKEECNCGRGMPMMADVKGRSTDFIVTRKGEMIHGEYFTHLFYDIEGVKKFQLIQESIDKVVIKIVKDKTLDNKNFENTKADIKKVLSDGIELEWSEVDDIPVSPSGKYLFTKSKILTRYGQLNE